MAHKPLLKKPLPDKKCVNCGDFFSPYRNWQEYCSPSCRGQYYWKTHAIVPVEIEPVLSPDHPNQETKTS